jgi:hypothetical protein
MGNKPKAKRTGPKPERVKVKGNWEDAIGKALKKERPKEGWPQQPVGRHKSEAKG